MEKFKIWSCKINRPETLKSHRTLDAAAKRVGELGFIYDPQGDKVYQVREMANRTLKLFDAESNSTSVESCGFSMREALANANIPIPQNTTTPIAV